MIKKSFINISCFLLLLTLVGCSSFVSQIDLTKLSSADDVNNAYSQNLDKIKNKEQIQELNITSLDQILKYAQNAKNISSESQNSSDKIELINKLVVLDDLSVNTNQNLKDQTLQYLESEYKNNKFENDLEKNYYLTYYLVNTVPSEGNHPHKIIIAMNDFIENTIKLKDSENDKETLERLIKDNKEKINKYVYTITEMYDSNGNKIEY